MKEISKRKVSTSVITALKKRTWAAVCIASFTIIVYSIQNSDISQAAQKPENHTGEVYTQAYIHDGDTLKLNGIKYRLSGIDAPELDQTCKNSGGAKYDCGIDSRNALRVLTKDEQVKCESSGRDRYKRELGICYIGVTNINAWMVEKGHAIAYRKYSQDFVSQEENAKQLKVGIWQGDFVNPEIYRKIKRKGK